MDNEDKIIDDFFKRLKETDKRQGIPFMEDLNLTVPEKTKSISLWPSLLKVAATVTLLAVGTLAFWIWQNKKPSEIYKQTEVIAPSDDMDELMSWEEPTKSLLNDF